MRKISHKIWFGTMFVVILLCIMIWGFQHYFLEDLYMRKLLSTISTDVFEVLDGFDADNPVDTYFQLDALAYRQNISVEVVNKDGTTIYVTGENPGVQFESITVKNGLQVVLLSMKGEPGDEPAKNKGAGNGNGTDTGGTGSTDSGQNSGDGQGSGENQGTGDGQNPDAGQEPGSTEPNGPEDPQGVDNSKGLQFMPESDIRKDIVEEALEGNEDSEEILHPKYGFRLLVLSIPFNSKQGDPYVALAAIPLAQIDNIVGLISMALLASIPIIIIIAGLASYTIASTISRPIRKLSTAAEAIGGGDLEARADIKSKDEVGSLGITFNVMAEQLKKAESMKREFVENVSHELRTPISVIKGCAETIRDVTGENKEKRNTQLSLISNEATRLGIMVSDILDYSRMTTDGIELETAEFDISDLVQDLTTKYQVLVKDSKITVEYNSKEQIRVKGDRMRLEQAIENLMRNAINYSPDGGAVRILATNSSDGVRVEIKDQGVGISKEELPMIWERYYRTRGIKKRKIYGSGLGLSIVRNVLEAHKASFGVESEPGEGTTFWFELPKENL